MQPGAPHASFWLGARPLILASASPTRRDLLRQSGLHPDIHAASVDERALEASAISTDRRDIAVALACAKALAVGAAHPGRTVLGADQTLALDGLGLHKPTDIVDAARTLRMLSGRTHDLHSGLALAEHGAIVWSDVTSATMSVRPLSDAFIAAYLEHCGPSVLASVGAYRYESEGIQLFDAVEGELSTILGLPLIPLFRALRARGLVLA